MKTLYLLRHAKSSWEDPDLDDFDRPLNGRGLRSAPKMGKYLAQLSIRPDAVWLSTSRRTRQTIDLILPYLDVSEGRIRSSEEFYLASGRRLLEQVRAAEAYLNSILLVGHQPGLGELAQLLCATAPDHIPTCGCLALELSSWKAELGTARILFFARPKALFGG